MEVKVLNAGEKIPARKKESKDSRRAIARGLDVAIQTLYDWEWVLHSSLTKLPRSFAWWRVVMVARSKGINRRPPLDGYQVECLELLAKLRAIAPEGETIAQTIRDNELRFFEIHERNA